VKKPKRILLGEGHPWFSGDHFDCVQLTVEPVPESILLRGKNRKTVPLAFRNIGNWNRVRLVLEVLK
jgi:hypothetical protein